MGRKVKERAFEEEGEAKRMPSNVDRKKFMQQLKSVDEKMADLRADRTAIYDAASNSGLDRKGLKKAYNFWKDQPSEDLRQEVNRNLAACGQAPLFAFSEAQEEGVEAA